MVFESDRGEGYDDRTKEIVFEMIRKLNHVELKLKELIIMYISPQREKFVNDVLLHNLVFNLSSKFKVLRMVISSEKIEVDKGFYNSFQVILNKRNIIAHTDGLSTYQGEFLYLDVDWNPDGVMESPVFEEIKLPITTVENDRIIELEIEKIFVDFNKHFDIVDSNLNSIQSQLIKIELIQSLE